MGYTIKQAENFIAKMAPMIKKEGNSRGYNVVSATIAQAIIEGAAGTSGLAKNYHNHFGLKCGQAWLDAGKPSVNMKTSEEYTPGKVTRINDYFRVYSDDAAGVKGYYDFISASRYKNLKTATDYRQFAEMLKADGYATSSTYVNTLVDTVRKYGLQSYDGGAVKSSNTRATIKKSSKGDDVMYLQDRLNYMGYDCGVADGIFGVKTEAAVKQFQSDRGLKADGIVGSQTWGKIET